ncbi:MAG: hypothetical protein R3242_05190, partial [Akkermansiaceae bacterium]|nr:hypothetical protein [Akkermansiaceae bacterium]
MKKYIFIAALLACNINAETLTDIGSNFVSSAVRGDFDGVEKTLWANGEDKDAMLAAMKGASGAIESGELKISHVNRQLIIGDLGVTLIRIEASSGEVDYDPLIYVKDESGWHILPYADERGLKAFAAKRTKDEQIHLELFDKWANLVAEQEQEAEQFGADQAVAAPGAKPEREAKPQPES